jgi:hypothetical protein
MARNNRPLAPFALVSGSYAKIDCKFKKTFDIAPRPVVKAAVPTQAWQLREEGVASLPSADM